MESGKPNGIRRSGFIPLPFIPLPKSVSVSLSLGVEFLACRKAVLKTRAVQTLRDCRAFSNLTNHTKSIRRSCHLQSAI